MAKAIINGREINIPDSATAEDIKKAGGIENGRMLINRKKDGNYQVKDGEKIKDGDIFVDAPARVKGF